MNVKTIKSLCGMLALLAFSACSSNIDESADAPRFYNVTLTASMGDAETRALSESGNVITATFTAGDKVKVLKSDGTEVGELTANTAGANTTLSGTISGTFSENEELTFRYRSATANYGGQVGTLAGIAAGQDYAEGTLTVTDPNTNPLTFESSSVTLRAKQSITKFTFKNGTNPINVKNFHITAAGLVQSIAANGIETIGAVTGALTSPSTSVYVALRNNTDTKQAYSFTVQDEAGNWYIATKNAKLTDGRNYAVDIALTPLPALTSTSEGAIGMLDGLPAIIVDFSGTKKAVALKNVGALYLEDYGTYYTFENRASGLTGTWYVPTRTELEALAAKPSTWGAPYGVNGRMFTIGSNSLFLPAAGLDDTDNDPSDFWKVSELGYYWSSDDPGEGLPFCLSFSSSVVNIISGYKTDALTVRPFHALN